MLPRQIHSGKSVHKGWWRRKRQSKVLLNVSSRETHIRQMRVRELSWYKSCEEDRPADSHSSRLTPRWCPQGGSNAWYINTIFLLINFPHHFFIRYLGRHVLFLYPLIRRHTFLSMYLSVCLSASSRLCPAFTAGCRAYMPLKHFSRRPSPHYKCQRPNSNATKICLDIHVGLAAKKRNEIAGYLDKEGRISVKKKDTFLCLNRYEVKYVQGSR